MSDALRSNIYDSFNQLIPNAIDRAPVTTEGWGAPTSAGGVWFSTYKALCRRYGVLLKRTQRPRNWNEELLEPISKHLAPNWERNFQHSLPNILDDFANTCQNTLASFHRAAIDEKQHDRRYVVLVNLLAQQLRAHTQSVNDISEAMKEKLADLQRDANRAFAPIIVNAMTRAYVDCAAQSGPGSFLRMKQIMTSHVGTARHAMFKDACDHVRDLLHHMVEVVSNEVWAVMNEAYTKVEQDYTNVLSGGRSQLLTAHPAEKLLCAQMRGIVMSSESAFAVVGL
jgi:hypothetical protein